MKAKMLWHFTIPNSHVQRLFRKVYKKTGKSKVLFFSLNPFSLVQIWFRMVVLLDRTHVESKKPMKQNVSHCSIIGIIDMTQYMSLTPISDTISSHVLHEVLGFYMSSTRLNI